MITPTLPYRKQQNIAHSQFFPYITVFEKKVGQIKIDATKLLMNEIKQNW